MFRDGVVGNISACHADGRGSIPWVSLRYVIQSTYCDARLAQMVERMTLNHVVAGSIPAVGVINLNK